MNDYTLTDRYGAVVMLNQVVETTLKEAENPKNNATKGSLLLAAKVMNEGAARIQKEIEEEFLNGLKERIRGMHDD